MLIYIKIYQHLGGQLGHMQHKQHQKFHQLTIKNNTYTTNF